ncbi:MAG: hypothetical protein ACI97N_002386, partial [Cognaticolwellia sp.]
KNTKKASTARALRLFLNFFNSQEIETTSFHQNEK